MKINRSLFLTVLSNLLVLIKNEEIFTDNHFLIIFTVFDRLKPWYRLYSDPLKDHYYTVDPEEREAKFREGYKKEGITAFVMGPEENRCPERRLIWGGYNGITKNHFFTLDKNKIVTNPTNTSAYCVKEKGQCSATESIIHFHHPKDDMYQIEDVIVAHYNRIKVLCYAWSKEAHCELPVLWSHGNLESDQPNSDDKINPGGTATLTCEQGYKLVGSSSAIITCSGNDGAGHWVPDPEDFGCQLIKYCPIPTVYDGSVAPNSGEVVQEGNIAKVECNTGFRVKNGDAAGTSTCEESGDWNPPVAETCEPIPTCLIPHVEHGQTEEHNQPSDEVYAGTTISISCDKGFRMSNGHGKMTCQESRNWNDEITCKPLLCDMKELLIIPHANIEDKGPIKAGEAVSFQCDIGRYPKVNNVWHDGSTAIDCSWSGNWETTNIECSGLPLTLFNNESEFLGHTLQNGIKLIIHKQGERVFPENQGRFLAPGFKFLIPITYVETKREESKCASEKFLKTVDYFYEDEYTVEGCLKTCYQKKVIAKCGCGDPRAGLDPKNKEVSYCTVKERDCVNSVSDVTSDCKCREPCSISLYEPTYSFTKWPAKNYRAPYCERIVQESIWKEEDLRRCNEACRSLHLKIDIYYKDLSYLVWTEYRAYTLANLWSDFGNLFDLFFGVGYMSFFELAVFLWHVFFITIGIKIFMYCRRLFANDVNPA